MNTAIINKTSLLFFAGLIVINGIGIYPATNGEAKITTNLSQLSVTEETEYWALLIAVGEYYLCPAMDRPTMLEEVVQLENVLIHSEHWSEDHIKVISGSDATLPNILHGFQWLDEMEDENDVCFIYLTTHGFPIYFDLPPFDEADRKDEALASYTGFLPISGLIWNHLANPLGILTDDKLNNLLNSLESYGVGVIVDSCHSGGMSDGWDTNIVQKNRFSYDFASEIQGQNRIVITSVPEEELSYGSFFSHNLIEGMKGFADENDDGQVSMEEAFFYAEQIVEEQTEMDPQIFDNYPGELIITKNQFPPVIHEIQGPQDIKTNQMANFNLSAHDPEGEKISFMIDWGDESSNGWDGSLVESNTTIQFSHKWIEEQTYNIRIKAKDEHNVESEWSNRFVITVLKEDTYVDQRQILNEFNAYLINDSCWMAQSFIPTTDILSKIDIEVSSWESGDQFTLSIRDNLSGPDIISKSMTPSISQKWYHSEWLSFDLNDLTITPGKIYYIVCRGSQQGWRMAWFSGSNNPYSQGKLYGSLNGGDTWETDWSNDDFCFINVGLE